jgi:hypothetical protein
MFHLVVHNSPIENEIVSAGVLYADLRTPASLACSVLRDFGRYRRDGRTMAAVPAVLTTPSCLVPVISIRTVRLLASFDTTLPA